MKKVINGLLYNTDTAKEVGFIDNGSVFNHRLEKLYKKRTGEYFIYEKNNQHEFITPVDNSEAMSWIEKNMNSEE